MCIRDRFQIGQVSAVAYFVNPVDGLLCGAVDFVFTFGSTEQHLSLIHILCILFIQFPCETVFGIFHFKAKSSQLITDFIACSPVFIGFGFHTLDVYKRQG